MEPVRFVQLSDPHVFTDPSGAPHGVDPNETLRHVVRRLLERPPMDFVVVTGDLVGDERISSYAVLRSLLAPLPCPVHLLAGNHDVRAGLWRELGPPGSGRLEPDPPAAELDEREDGYFYEFDAGGQRFLALDSQIPGEVPGRIDEQQMRWIADRLTDRPDVPTIVFVHHPPIATGVEWLDEHRIENGRELMALVQRGNVKRVLFGHVHMPMTISWGSIVCTSAPSTCYGFSDGVAGPVVAGRRPGFQVIETDGADVRSHLEWI
jgi:3',5'-cyclic AMP phosphodiesterase CpdA